ncbi:MAG: hypothetical protein QG609_409 [Patescibacteria group bacterium]|nr:hypothetical protein [Patescibacteria group bacterium]
MINKYKKSILGFVVLCALLGGAYYFGSVQQVPDEKEAEALIAKEASDLVTQVGAIMEIPAELPAVATIIDETKVSNEPFFSGAKNGDKILVFVQSQKLVIYRPSTNKIINSIVLNLPLN